MAYRRERLSFGNWLVNTAGKLIGRVTNSNEDVFWPVFNEAQTALLLDETVMSLSEVSAYVNLTATGTAHTGAGEFGGYICTVAAGNITVYDNTSAAGTVIVPTTALVVGSFPIMGAGTNTRLALTTGCHVVLSGAPTVN